MNDESFDVIVIGAGHAGIEAASASARIGCSTLLLTQNLDTIGQMSCNPAIGGLGKGQLVREIDALGGFMGVNADATGIQFRMLNRSKGVSVQAPRVQCDKKAYQFRAKVALERTQNLYVRQTSVRKILKDEGRVHGVETDLGTRILARSVVLTSGTFLSGVLHLGNETKTGGRMADTASGLSADLVKHGFRIGRFKTGTPCRINRRSIDFDECEMQLGDDPPPRFSFAPPEETRRLEMFTINSSAFHVEQIPCWITRTSEETHGIIRKNLSKSALYSGKITGRGPRYCPSVEDKVVKFTNRSSHQIFLEPEGLHTDEFYVNGLSTSLPYSVQAEFIRTIPGLKRAEIIRPGYAVEYDFFPPTQLSDTLEARCLPGMYLAGQVNGSSGYEEAAAQGLVAGANAALSALGRPALRIDRTQGYIGVLIDDLVRKGVEEPYRMFTSRAESRLAFRHDTADQRLTPIGYECGLTGEPRWEALCRKVKDLAAARALAHSTWVDGKTIAASMRQENFSNATLSAQALGTASVDIWNLLETDLKLEGYVRREARQNVRLASRATQGIPVDFDFDCIKGLRVEARQRLKQVQPITVGEAAEVSGVTAADVAILSICLGESRT